MSLIMCKRSLHSSALILFVGEKSERKINMGLKTWTKEEENLLTQHFYNYSDNELHEIFLPNKSPKAIERKISRMNLGKKSPDVKQRGTKKMANTKKEYYKTHDGVNKGKVFSEESRQKMSLAKKSINKWKGKDNPRHQNPLFGKDNGNWQGGITNLYRSLRNELGVWYSNSINFCGYKCILTGEHFDDVHHFYSFKSIMQNMFLNVNIDMRSSQEDYTEMEWDIISKELLRLHKECGFGICIKKELHMLFHDKYTYHSSTPYDFLDFVYRLDCGEFDNWLNENDIDLNINYEFINYLENTLLLPKSV